MKQIALGIVVVLMTCPLQAAATSNSNTLTREEIGDGWLLLFDGQMTFGWSGSADLKADGGMLTATAGAKAGFASTISEFGDFEMRFEYRIEEKSIGIRGRIFWERLPDAGPIPIRACSAGLVHWPAKPGAQEREWVHGHIRLESGKTNYEVGHIGDSESEQGINLPVSAGRTRGPITLWVAPGGRVSIRNVRLRALGMRPIFYGKNLDGWKEHPGKKSKFCVTKEGWLNVKDGPGDLQTTGQFDNFILQLDCLSNGKHLNSGVFFRCRPDEYQQGYEAQVHNGFLDTGGKEYIVEELDPKTHELTAKRKVMSPAIDYGTGGIYRRMPARRALSRDGEWFTMTVIADGRHIATWVNGVQQVDWTDNRRLKDNARQGCRLEKGAISIQGHDATTDLSFRNLRLVELPAEK
jgi:hypothetical protein